MAKVVETPHPPVLQLVTGHFHEGSGYGAYRSGGTGDWLLILTLSGRGRFAHAGGELLAEPGDWVLLRPNTPHDYGVEPTLKQWELLWTHFHPRPHWLAWLAWPEVSPGLMKLRFDPKTFSEGASDAARSVAPSRKKPVYPDPVARFHQVHALANSSYHRRQWLALNALEEVLLWCDQFNPAHADESIDARIREAMDFLSRNLNQKILLDDVAAAVGLSVSRLSHLFKQEVGRTPQQFLESMRLERAAELLQRTSFSIKQISASVGFDSPFYFSLRFKSRMKQSPKAFRAASRR